MDTIYMVVLSDYDRHEIWGYFDDRDKANECCEFLNKKYPSDYVENDDDDEFKWQVEEYGLDTTDYATEIAKFDQQQKDIRQQKLEREKEDVLRALSSIQARLDALNTELTQQKGND